MKNFGYAFQIFMQFKHKIGFKFKSLFCCDDNIFWIDKVEYLETTTIPSKLENKQFWYFAVDSNFDKRRTCVDSGQATEAP